MSNEIILRKNDTIVLCVEKNIVLRRYDDNIVLKSENNVSLKNNPVDIITLINSPETVVLKYAKSEIIASVSSGPQGPQGLQGPQGFQGVGVAPGGATNDILYKTSNNNFETSWTASPTLDSVNFDTTANITPAVGQIAWGAADGTLDFAMSSGVVQQVGMSFYMPPTKNDSGVVIPAGSFVMATGAQGDRITIAKAVTDGSVDPMYMIGVAAKNIAIGAEDGKILTNGTVYQINTNGWIVGTILYPDPATPGGLTNVQPVAPAVRTPIAIVLRQQQNTGRIYVRMTNGSILGGSDSNVRFGSLVDNDLIVWDDDEGVWVNKSPDQVPGLAGPQGPQGPQGFQGYQGPQGVGVIPGGTTGQVFEKLSDSDYDVQWSTRPRIINTDGDLGQTIYIGSIDPSISYTLIPGDVWIEVP